MNPWSFRGVQLDLARQMETVAYIRAFIDFMAQHRLNVLVLYLEGRIRTPSFPYPSEAESYSPQQMKEVVAYATARGVEVVPVVSNLGHGELFLRYPQMASLAELRGGRTGRFGTSVHVFCPSLPETYRFFEEYFRELAEIFPSRYLHVGNDEAWDIGYCDLCRPRAESAEGQSGIFARHLCDTHAIVTGKLGRRMMMWDDLFEHYPNALRQIPRDIIQCCWQYGADSAMPAAHFWNRRRWDALGEYAELGMDYVVVPRETSWRNILSLTRYAMPHQPLGGFVSSWEHSTTFLLAWYPNIAFAGRLWSDPERVADGEGLVVETLRELFPAVESDGVEAMRAFLSLPRMAQATTVDGFLREFSSNRLFEREELNRRLQSTLRRCVGAAGATGTLGGDVVEDALVNLDVEALQLDLRRDVGRVFRSLGAGAPMTRFAAPLLEAVDRIADLHGRRQRQWARYRPGIASTDNALDHGWETFRQNMADLAAQVASGKMKPAGLLFLDCFLPDAYSAQWLRVAVQYENESAWSEVGQGVWKPLLFDDDEYDHSGYYRVIFRMRWDSVPRACRLESWGYGGQGIRCVEMANGTGRYVPDSVGDVTGLVETPHHVLDNSASWCYLGEFDTQRAFLHPHLAQARHALTVRLRRAKRHP